ncbi:1,4-dihydroxy-2-naphthoate polyprenyltransferase [Bacillus massiliigorillae]|uniref:1,4-dihydroxy-2-naphthoate polyprenyltransferase n=1 Tax=Bacillus massiliigorillae TaxID=1243664 RepID=UPI0003A07AAF|nr:1,4-dihydroxy-2-naphthoate polyprenyltransferase [Bacillus massiliigorillae]
MPTQINTQPESVTPNKPGWRVWWQLTRPHTLTAGFVPVLIGTALAMQSTDINLLLFSAMLIATLLIQAATNMFNEYYDFELGLDNENSIGIGGTIVRDGVHPKTVLKIAFSLYGIAALLGVYICATSSWWLVFVGLVSMAVGYFYTGGPYPIAYTPFGELFSGFFMGMLIILIAFFIQTGTLTSTSFLVSMPIAFLVGAILLSNSIRDIDEDTEGGRKTLAILLGKKNAIVFLAGMFTGAYVWIIVLVLLNIVTPWVLLVILSVPKPLKAVKGFIGKETPLQMMPAMKATAQTNTIFGFLLSVGLFLSYYL